MSSQPLGTLLRGLRQESQRATAKRLGISQPYLCDIEHNRRAVPMFQVERFAMVYGLDAAWLAGRVAQAWMESHGWTADIRAKKVRR